MAKETQATKRQGGSSEAEEHRPGATPRPGQKTYEAFMDAGRERVLEQVRKGYESFMETRTFKVPTWLYGPPKGTLFKVKCEDSPDFGETSHLEFDSGRTAFLSIDMQIDFAGDRGYVDVMGYPLENTARAIAPIQRSLEAVRGTDITVVHTREGHLPDLSDAPYNKLLRSKIIGNGVGIGEAPEGGLGRLLVRGDTNWDIIDELYPLPGEIVVDKAGKGALAVSTLFMRLQNQGITHLVITGITTDVCVDTIMTQANDLGFWCMLLKDCTGATDDKNYEAAVKMIKMQGGVFGWVSDSASFIQGLEEAGLARQGKGVRREPSGSS
ncbi:MAG TPA: cysteine hydrolase [Candidatus Thermoplasmatota archaeon]|nr:cysteine hydrolase [Candidatus Thermoplasmatota archaeon]